MSQTRKHLPIAERRLQKRARQSVLQDRTLPESAVAVQERGDFAPFEGGRGNALLAIERSRWSPDTMSLCGSDRASLSGQSTKNDGANDQDDFDDEDTCNALYDLQLPKNTNPLCAEETPGSCHTVRPMSYFSGIASGEMSPAAANETFIGICSAMRKPMRTSRAWRTSIFLPAAKFKKDPPRQRTVTDSVILSNQDAGRTSVSTEDSRIRRIGSEETHSAKAKRHSFLPPRKASSRVSTYYRLTGSIDWSRWSHSARKGNVFAEFGTKHRRECSITREQGQQSPSLFEPVVETQQQVEDSAALIYADNLPGMTDANTHTRESMASSRAYESNESLIGLVAPSSDANSHGFASYESLQRETEMLVTDGECGKCLCCQRRYGNSGADSQLAHAPKSGTGAGEYPSHKTKQSHVQAELDLEPMNALIEQLSQSRI